MIDCRVVTNGKDSRVEALYSRVVCDVVALDTAMGEDGLRWADDGTGVLAFTTAEEKAIVDALKAAGLPYTIEPATPIDQALLDSLRGAVTSRTEALAAITAGKAPPTIDSLATRIDTLETSAGTNP